MSNPGKGRKPIIARYRRQVPPKPQYPFGRMRPPRAPEISGLEHRKACPGSSRVHGFRRK